jgi:hypothetical protein
LIFFNGDKITLANLKILIRKNGPILFLFAEKFPHPKGNYLHFKCPKTWPFPESKSWNSFYALEVNKTASIMDLSVIFLIFIVDFVVSGSIFYGIAKFFFYKKPRRERAKYISYTTYSKV